MTDPRPIIMTATMDDDAQKIFDELRAGYFPPERNYLKAHITLFHALPSERAETVFAGVKAQRHLFPMHAHITGLRFLGNGVAYDIDCPALMEFRRNTSRDWQDWLTPQDRQKPRLHITVQNKVDAATARQTFADLQQKFTPLTMTISSVKLWRYNGGPWAAIDDQA